MKRFDVAIAGGGLIGSSAALALANSGRQVALIEAAAPSKPDPAVFDLRVSAISPHSQAFLQSLDLWERLPQDRVCYYDQMKVWHDRGDAMVAFDAAELARQQLGAIVENIQILTVLAEACEQHQRVTLFQPTRVDAIVQNDSENLVVSLDSGDLVEADLLLVAEGRASSTREMAGFESSVKSYEQTALVTNVSTELPHEHTAWQRFLQTGPLAFLPLANGDCSIVWSCDNEKAGVLLSLSDEAFCEALGEAFEYRLGEVISTSKRASFPLSTHHCEQWVRQRVVLVGDAAHSVHPLAGQGVNLGFSDVECLVNLLAGAENISDPQVLRRYERRRKSDTWIAANSFSALKEFYGSNTALVGRFRDFGMRLVGDSAPLKRMLISRALENMV